jgi:hypothetical protein
MAAWWTLAEDKMRESKGKARESRSAQQLSEDYQVSYILPLRRAF